MFRALRQRALGALLRRTTPVAGGPRRAGGKHAPGPAAAPIELIGSLFHAIPAQAHRAPHLEQINDLF